MKFLDQIPEAIRNAAHDNPREVVRAANDLKDRDLGLLILWHIYVDDGDIEYGRILAIECGKPPESPVSQACRLWLMTNISDDLGIWHTLIGYLQRDLAEQKIWPDFLAGQVLHFINEALKHREISVKAEVLALLILAVNRNLLGQVVHAGAATMLTKALEHGLRSEEDALDSDELDDLETIIRFLEGESVPSAPRLNSRALQRLVLDIKDAIDKYAKMIEGPTRLLEVVQRRALLDDASTRVARAESPLQTVRIKTEQTPTRLIQTIVGFGEAVVGMVRNPDFAKMDAPDYGLQMSWAPAASMPIHISYDNDDARSVFEILEQMVNAAAHRRQFLAKLEKLTPDVAAAFLRILQRLEQSSGEIEVVLTDPQSPTWQRSITFGRTTFTTDSISSLMKQSRNGARAQRVMVPGHQVPQANTVNQVFQAVDAMLQRGVVTPDDIAKIDTPRQVNYYKQGARILAFFDDDNQPTSRAYSIVGLTHEQRLSLTAVYFEDSVIGRAWRSWAGVNHLSDVDSNSAQDFLEQCVHGLTGSTPGRRASTLRAWYAELVPKYPAGRR